MCAMVKTCRPIWKRQARETFHYMSGTDLRQSVAFRWRILPRLSRCCANQDRRPDLLVDRWRSGCKWSLPGFWSEQTCKTFNFWSLVSDLRSPMEAWLHRRREWQATKSFFEFFTVPIRNKKLVCSSRICSVAAIADMLKCGNNRLGRTLWKEFL